MEAVILPLGSESSPNTKNLNLKSMVILAHTLEVSKTGYKNFIYVSPPPPRGASTHHFHQSPKAV